MKKFLLLIALIISGVGFVNAQNVYEGYYEIVGPLQFTVTSLEPAECSVTGYDGSPTDIIIPATVTFGETELEVTSIGDDAFRDCSSLTGIEIPSGVTSIGGFAFEGCSSLINISFGEDSQLTSIELYAFYGCHSLTSIEIPSGAPSIGEHAFMNCSSLTNISFGENSQLTSIGSSAFWYCSSLTSIEIPSGVTSIGYNAFEGCYSLTNISFGENSQLTSIGEHAFSGCSSLTSIEIPSGVTEIGNYVFAFVDEWGNSNGESNLESVTFGEDSQLTSIGNCAFAGCPLLTNIEIPSGVTSIGEYAFLGCSSLTNISFGEDSQLSSIGSSAFNGCSSLTNISFGEDSQLTSIGSEVFMDCSSLTGIDIPSGVTSIGDAAFSGCSSLTSVSFGDNSQLASIGWGAFKECYGLTSIEIPSGVTSIGWSVFYGCSNLTSVTFGDNSQLASIGDEAFYGCSNLTSVTFGENSQLNYIGDGAFSWTCITSIDIPSSVTYLGVAAFAHALGGPSPDDFVHSESNVYLSVITFGENSQLAFIGDGAFYSCSALKSIEIPSGVTAIGNYAFYSCSALKSIEIPSGVTSIGRYAFSGCSNLKSIEIPSGVTSIERDAFSGCSNLKSVSFEDNSQLTSIGDWAFGSCSGLTGFELPSNVTKIGDAAFAGCTGLETITVSEDNDVFDSRDNCNAIIKTSENKLVVGCKNTIIPNSVTSIGDFAFYDCYFLTNIEIPSGVTAIGNYAFSDCSNLTSVTFGENSQLASIGECTFRSCSSLTSIEIPSNVTSIADYAFQDCLSLISLTFGDNSKLSYIGDGAFADCHITSIEIPSGVTMIGNDPFGLCSYIISYMETPIVFELYSWVETLFIFVPESSVEDYESTYPWSNHEILPIDPASVNVTVNDEEAGSVVGAGDYCKSMVIRLLATPNRGYDFVGWKEDGEIVSTDSDYYFTLYGDRNLEAVFELSKYWHPDLHLYPNTMNMITEVKVDGELQNSTLLEVGAFCGDELRGSGRIQYNAAADKYIAYISVMGETDDQIKFRLFDHETYQELSHASLSVLPFETNAIVGTVTEPYLTEFSSTARVTVTVNPSDAGYVEGAGDYPIGSLVSLKATNYLPYLFESWTINGEVVGTTKTYNFVATESVNIKANFTCSQRTELSSGWNWTSFHTFIYGYNGLLALELSLGDYGLHIKNQNSFVTNHNGTWYGSLTSVDVEQMYIIRVSEDFTLVLNGLVVNPENYKISLTKNWKWIGYPVSVEMPVAEAFSGISPSEGDVVKTQGEFAMYNEGIGWSGNLTKMKPGKGYMYYNNSNSTKTLTYPTPSSGQSRSVETEDEITHWIADNTKYPGNMNMVAVLNVDGNELGANYEIAAFAGEELRGNARPIYIEALGRYMVFLTINGEESENLKFKYYNEETDEEFDITENIMFSMNAVVGSVDEPYVFNCNINDEANNTAEIEVYPNPVNAGEEINLGMTYDKVEIYNAIGAKIAEYNNVNKLAQIEIAGVYVIKATIGGEVKYDRLIVQ